MPFIYKKVSFLVNIERCPKILEHAMEVVGKTITRAGVKINADNIEDYHRVGKV